MNQRPHLRILYLESDPDQCQTAQETLVEAYGEECVEATTDPEELLFRLATQPFDVVFLDAGLWNGRALETLRKIVGRGYTLPIVMIGRKGSERIIAEAMRMGAYDYVMKNRNYLGALPSIAEQTWRRYRAIARERDTLSRITSEAFGKVCSTPGKERPLTANSSNSGRELDEASVTVWPPREPAVKSGRNTESE